MKYRFNFQDKEVLMDVKLCKSFLSKLRGLMFRRDKKTLLFVFDKPTKTGIHSLFVFQNFLAIWIRNNQVVDVKIVKPWKLCITSKQEFDRLLEIPFESELEISNFLVGSKKDLNT